MQVRQIPLEDRKQVRRFVDFPFKLYGRSPYWGPPMRADLVAALDRSKHPYFRHSDATLFLAESAGEVVGRVSLFHHRQIKEEEGQYSAYFNHFDLVDDVGVARELIASAGRWAGERGLTQLIGPFDSLLGNGFGLLTEGFELPAALGMPHNPPYLCRLLDELGFEKRFDALSGEFRPNSELPANLLKLGEMIRKNVGVTITAPADMRQLRKWIPLAGNVFTQIEIPGQINPVPTEEEWKYLIRHFLPIVDPRLVKLAFKGDELIGFLFAYPDPTAGIRKAQGRLWPLGWWPILKELRARRVVNINALGVLPQYRGSGINLLLYVEMYQTLRQMHGVERVEIIQVGEHNIKSFGDMSAMGVRWTKRHRVYRRDIAQAS